MRKIALKILAILVIVLFINTSPGRAQDAIVKRDQISTGSYLDYVILDPLKVRFHVVSSHAQYKEYGFSSYESYFISDFQAKTKATIILTGGYLSKFSPTRPLGLVRVGNQTLNGPISTWVGAGVFCTDGKRVLIQRFDRQVVESYPDCVQSGPLLIEKGVVRYRSGIPIQSGEQKLVQSVQEQTFLCENDRRRIVLGVSSPVKLDQFSLFLRDRIGCLNAIRFSGQDTAGMMVKSHLYGYEDLPLFSVIAVFFD